MTDDREPPPLPPPRGVPQWPPPPAAGRKHPVRWVVGCLVAVVLAWVISLPLVIWLADTSIPHPSRQPVNIVPENTYETIKFGLGGAGCSLATIATTFSAKDQIRLVAAGAMGGGEASILLLRGEGTPVAGYPATRPIDPRAGCMYDLLPPLPPDHYSVWISIPPGPLVVPRFMGEFDVTP